MSISIRNAKFAKIGLQDMLNHIGQIDTMVEIGCYVGDSTEIFAKYVKTIYAVDPWENGYDDTDPASYQHSMNIIENQFNLLLEIYPNILKMKMASLDAVNQFEDNSLDMVYIDGLHTYEGVKNDIEAWLPKIKKTGWLCGHDYQGRFPGTIRAIDEFKKPDKIFKDTSWCIKL